MSSIIIALNRFILIKTILEINRKAKFILKLLSKVSRYEKIFLLKNWNELVALCNVKYYIYN